MKIQCEICNRTIAHEQGKLIEHIQGVHNMKLETFFNDHVSQVPITKHVSSS